MKLLKISFAVSAITAVLMIAAAVFTGCSDEKEIVIQGENNGNSGFDMSKARIAFYGGGERRGSGEVNKYTNAHLNPDGTPRKYGTNTTHEPHGFKDFTIEEAYVLLKYPGLNAGHYSTNPAPNPAPATRHAGGWFGLEKNPDPTSSDPDHPICETYAINIMKIDQQYLSSLEVAPGEYGEPYVRVFWPGAAGADAEKWWNRVKDVDPDGKAKNTLKDKNAGFYIRGSFEYLEDGNDAPTKYTYEIISRKELGPQTWTGGVGTEKGYTSSNAPAEVGYWTIPAGKTLHFNIHPHTDHWRGRFLEFQVYKDLPALADANNHVVFNSTTMANYTLRPSVTGLTDATGKTFMDIIEAEFSPKPGFDSDFSEIRTSEFRGLD